MRRPSGRPGLFRDPLRPDAPRKRATSVMRTETGSVIRPGKFGYQADVGRQALARDVVSLDGW